MAQSRTVFGIAGALIIAAIAVYFIATRSSSETTSLKSDQGATPTTIGDHTATSTQAPSANSVITQPTAPTIPVAPPFEPIEHPVLSAFVSKDAANRLPTDFPERVPTITDANDIKAVLYVLNDASDSDTIRNEAINLLRRSHIKDLDKQLLQILDAPDEKDRFRSFVVQHLGDMMVEFIAGTEVGGMTRSGYIRDRLVKALSDKDLSVRRESVLALTKIREPAVTKVIHDGLQDPTWTDAHDILIRCAFETQATDLIPAIRPFAYDERTPVRIAAIVSLSQWKDAESKPAFEEASRSTVVRIQRAGTLALQTLTQQQ